MIPTHITVTAPPGRVTPIHPADGSEPGGGQLRVVSGEVVRVRYSQFIRRRIAADDLIMCDMNGARVASAELAAAPDELPSVRVRVPTFDLSERPTVRGKAIK